MEFYLVRLTYTAAAWQELLDNTTNLDQRLAPVRRLIKHLGGSLATFHFYETAHYADPATPPFVVHEKMAMFGEHNLLAILAMPDKAAAQAFNMAISAEPGLKVVDLVSIMPLEDAIAAMPVAKNAVQATRYAAPGRTVP
jgi:uncharacterized protein with GYD domain